MWKVRSVAAAAALAASLVAGPIQGQIPGVSPLCADRAPALGLSPFDVEVARPSRSGGRPVRPASDLYCSDLLSTQHGGDATGVVELSRPWSPFGVTANGAKVLGIDDDVGTVEAGKLADLVVIEGDLEAVRNLHGTKIIFRHGIGWDSAKLIASIRGIVGIR